MEDADKEALSAVFEEIHDGLGDALTEDVETFKMIKSDMDAGEMKAFCVALLPTYFEIEGVDSVTD